MKTIIIIIIIIIVIIIIIIIINSITSAIIIICPVIYYYYYYYYYSAIGLVWAGTKPQSGDRYGSCTLHPGQVLRGSLQLLSPAFRHSHFYRQVPPRPVILSNYSFIRENRKK